MKCHEKRPTHHTRARPYSEHINATNNLKTDKIQELHKTNRKIVMDSLFGIFIHLRFLLSFRFFLILALSREWQPVPSISMWSGNTRCQSLELINIIIREFLQKANQCWKRSANILSVLLLFTSDDLMRIFKRKYKKPESSERQSEGCGGGGRNWIKTDCD